MNVNVYTNFSLILSIDSQDIELKRNDHGTTELGKDRTSPV